MDIQRKEFAVVAGPNGAGKSTLCQYYIKSQSFDGDLLALNLRKEHPDWPDRWIYGTVASSLEKQKIAAIESRQNFAFETNFSNDLIINMINDFKNANFKISLYYFGIDRLDESMQRVKRRTIYGGHNVDDETIRFNYFEGTKRLKENLHLFDYMTFIDGLASYGKVVATYRAKDQYIDISENPPLWFKEHFEQRFR